MELIEKNVEIEQKYKKTEFGVIPIHWEEFLLCNCCSKITDGTHDTPKPTATGVPYLTAVHVKENNIAFKDCYYLPEEVHREIYQRCNPEKGDILMVNIGAGVGTTALIEVDFEFSLKNVALLKPYKNSVSGRFLNYVLTFLKDKITGNLLAGGAQPFFSLKQIGQIQIPLPPTLQEQRAIATALSDVDALIRSLGELIDKKRAVKQGAMQELLTGKRRLAGFEGDVKEFKESSLGLIPEDWIDTVFGEVFTGFSSGMTPYRGKPEYYKGRINWITSGELNYNLITDTEEKITQKAVDDTNLKILSKGTFLMAITGLEAAGTRGSCGIVGKEATTNQSCMAIFPTKMTTTAYLFHFYVRYGNEFAFKFCQGTKQQSYTGRIVKILPIVLPPTIQEQIGIARVLSEMDAEITALETKQAKYQQIKQGMMQELLTGKTRLV